MDNMTEIVEIEIEKLRVCLRGRGRERGRDRGRERGRERQGKRKREFD